MLPRTKQHSFSGHEAHLHHLEFLRIGQIPRSRVVAYDIGVYVNVGPVNQPLLDILQHLLHHCIKGPQLRG